MDLGNSRVLLLFVPKKTPFTFEQLPAVRAGQLANGGAVVLAVVLGDFSDRNKLVADATDVKLTLG